MRYIFYVLTKRYLNEVNTHDVLFPILLSKRSFVIYINKVLIDQNKPSIEFIDIPFVQHAFYFCYHCTFVIFPIKLHLISQLIILWTILIRARAITE